MPEPSRLVLLEQLSALPSGTKIRLLGCIHYHASKARVTVRDKYPSNTSEHPTAVVDIERVLENVNHELLQVGSWINIIGYIRQVEGHGKRDMTGSTDGSKPGKSSNPVNVEATMIWSAGAIKLDKYKQTARGYQKLPSAR